LTVTANTASFFYTPPSWFEPFDWRRVFAPVSPDQPALPDNSEIQIDLGAGDGGFLIERAKRHPDVRFLGVERLLGRVRKISKRAFRGNLTNVRVIRIEASYAVQWLFPPETVDAITVLFPDPWPKRRHHHHRLVQPQFLEHCARCLKKNGWLAIKTDDQPYFSHIRETLDSCRALREWHNAPVETLLPEMTDFEREFTKEKRTFHLVVARRA
jgi:tRNA (guanine-N7-)-methyltransferase